MFRIGLFRGFPRLRGRSVERFKRCETTDKLVPRRGVRVRKTDTEKRIMAVPIVRAPGTRVPSLRFGIGKLLSFALLVFSIQSTAYAWPAKDSITGQLIEVMSPP